MKILAIDPGYEKLGIAILDCSQKKQSLLYSECFKTSAHVDFPDRLKKIGQKIRHVISKYRPEMLSIETIFLNTNQKTAMRVAEARGVIIYEARLKGMDVREFTPLEIKMAILGYGRGDKKQIISMIPKLIKIGKNIKDDDEYDAIAAGITCAVLNKMEVLQREFAM